MKYFLLKFSNKVLVVVLLTLLVNTTEALAQPPANITIRRMYSPWHAGSWDSASWQVLNSRGQVVGMVPMTGQVRWANQLVPVAVYEVSRRDGSTVWISEDSTGNRQIFQQDPLRVAQARALELDAQAEYKREMAEIDQWQKNKQLRNLRRADRLLASDVHRRATEAYTAEADSGVYSGAAAIRDGFRVGEVAYDPQQPNANWRSRQGAPVQQPAASAATDSGSTQNPLALAAMEAHKAYFQLQTDNQQLKDQTRDLFWERAAAWVKEASSLQTKAGHTEAIRRLEQLIDRVDDELQNLEWPEQRDELVVEWLSLSQ